MLTSVDTERIVNHENKHCVGSLTANRTLKTDDELHGWSEEFHMKTLEFSCVFHVKDYRTAFCQR
jgi:hypothetical protein